MKHAGLYRAVVVDNADPEDRLRLRVRVPSVTGTAVVGWVWPCLPSLDGVKPPTPGEGVFVQYEAGDPDFPVWVGVSTATPAVADEDLSPVEVAGYSEVFPVQPILNEIETNLQRINFARPFVTQAFGLGGEVTVGGSNEYPLFIWRGAWTATPTGSSYNPGDVVTKGGKLYIAKPEVSGVEDPEAVGQTQWALLAESGTPTAAISYVYTQGAAASFWTVTHNLGFFPSVTVIDSGGTEVEGDVDYISSNQLTITFSAAFSGTAYLS